MDGTLAATRRCYGLLSRRRTPPIALSIPVCQRRPPALALPSSPKRQANSLSLDGRLQHPDRLEETTTSLNTQATTSRRACFWSQAP